MIADGICISWWRDTEEYVEVNLDAPDRLGPVDMTREWWIREGIAVRYRIESETRSSKSGRVILVLRYRREWNDHLDGYEIIWGRSEVHLARGAGGGRLYWYPEEGGKYRVEWTRVNPGLFKEIRRRRRTEIERLQQKFRGFLLAEGCRCALTGEATAEALEAAHIIPSRLGGAEKLQNGILLRADIHRLYDNSKFRLDPEGYVVGLDNVSVAYRKLLEGRCLDKQSLDRVRDALVHQSKSE